MTQAEVFRGTKSGLTFLFAYQQTVAQEIGLEQAMALNSKMVQALGTAQGRALRAGGDIEEITPQAAASLAGEFLEHAMGIRSRMRDGRAEGAVIEVGRCPIYEAAAELGMEHSAIEALCRAGSILYMDALVKQLNPDLSYELTQFRPAAEGPCVEAIVAKG